MENTTEKTAVENDYDMEPNADGQGQMLYGNEELKDNLLTVLNIVIAAFIISLTVLSYEIQHGTPNEKLAENAAMTFLGSIIIHIILDKILSRRFSKTLYKNPAVCSEKRFYMEAAKAVQNAGFETERSFFTYFSNGKGLLVTKPGLFDYTMVIYYNPTSNTFSIANKKIIGKPDLDDLAMAVENQLYSKYCPQIVAAIQKRLKQCANSVERCKEEDLNSDNSGFVKTFATGFTKSLLQLAIIVGVIILLFSITSVI